MHTFFVIYGCLGLLTAFVVQIGAGQAANEDVDTDIHPAFLLVLTLLTAFTLWPITWLVMGISVYRHFSNKDERND